VARRALLLGVDDYGDPALELAAPANDVDRLADTLTRLLGYEATAVRALVSSRKPALTTNTLRREIDRFCTAAEAGDELLIYFSRHGMEWQGHRLLVPPDYYTDDPRPRSELLADSDLYALARRSPARQVLFVIDACREGVHLEVVADKSPGPDPTDQAAPDPEGPTVAVLFSCAAGAYSYAVSGDQPFSYFTRAFADALGEEGEAATLREVIGLTQAALDRLLPAGAVQVIHLDERPNLGRAGQPAGMILRENQAARLRRRMAASPWCQAVTAGPLWPLLAGEPEGLRDQVLSICLESEDLVRRAAQALPDQRWRDGEAPHRVIHRLARLLGERLGETLSPADAAVAIAVPLVYESVLAAAELALVGAPGKALDPLDSDALARADGRLGRTLRERYASDTAWARRRALLVRRGLNAAARDLTAWQLTRFLHESGEVWDWGAGSRGDDPDLVAMHGALARVLTLAPLKTVATDPRIGRLLDGPRLVALARLLFAGFDEIEQQRAPDCTHPLKPSRPFGEGTGAWSLEEVKLAHLLSLAADMALDPRRLSPLIPEHLGLAAEIEPARVRRTLAQCAWHPDGKGLALGLECPHEAIDAALREQVRTLDAHLHRLARGEALDARQRGGLPEFISDRRLEPERIDGQPRYRTDHLGFSLDQGRVRELLMGESLYGKPALALRELYQNALDACRYRRARDRWLRATGQLDDATPPYRGRITFNAGEDEGRAFIECGDNGIGMAERHLRTLFAKAGRRFADSHEFHLELADWEAAGIRFWPNSRFGIGVFSYFMLADEVLIESQRDRRPGGSAEAGFRARVSGSGGLFRVQQTNDLIQSGTRVRLYLSEGHGDTEALLAGIDEWLWVPEFETRIRGAGERVMAAGQPGPVMVKKFGPFAPIPESADDAGQCRVWWHSHENGVLLADGLNPLYRNEQFDSHSEGIAALVVNLTESERPELSVDRSEITQWDIGKRWLWRLLLESGWVHLAAVPDIQLSRLGELFAHYPRLIRWLDQALRSGNLRNCRIGAGGRDNPIKDASIGICPADNYLMSPDPRDPRVDDWDLHETLQRLLRGRLQRLKRAGIQHHWPPFDALQGFDADRDWPDLPLCAWHLVRSLPVGLGGFLVTVANERFSEREIGELHASLAALGLEIPMTSAIPPELKLSQRQIKLLSRNLDGRPPWLSSIPPGHLVLASEKWSLSLKEVKDLVVPLVKLGIGAANLDLIPDRLELTEAQMRLWSRHHQEEDHWWGLWRDQRRFLDRIPAFHLVRSASEWPLELAEIKALARTLGGIGVPIPDLDTLPDDLVLDELQLSLLPPLANSDAPESEAIPLGTLLGAGERYSLALGDVLDRAKPLLALGLTVPVVDDTARVFRADREQMDLISAGLNGKRPWVERVTIGHLLRAAGRWRASPKEARAIAAPLEQLGIPVPRIPQHAEIRLRDRWVYAQVVALLERSGVRSLALDAWDLCKPVWDDGPENVPLPTIENPADYREALEVLGECGMDVTEALAFAKFCAARTD